MNPKENSTQGNTLLIETENLVAMVIMFAHCSKRKYKHVHLVSLFIQYEYVL